MSRNSTAFSLFCEVFDASEEENTFTEFVFFFPPLQVKREREEQLSIKNHKVYQAIYKVR